MLSECEVCKGLYEVHERLVSDSFYPILDNDSIRVKQIYGHMMHINHFNVCPKCSTRILNFIKNLQEEK